MSYLMNSSEILQTIEMINQQHLDVRTITMGISLFSCVTDDEDRLCKNVYDHITRRAENLVKIGREIEREIGVPIVNKRISVTPVSMISGSDPLAIAVALDKAAQQGDETKYSLPVAKPGENPYNMSFSGLKTAALNLIHHAEQVAEELDINSLCAAFCAAVSDTLVPRVVQAMKQTGRKKLAVAGGVAANSRIRNDILSAASKLGAQVYLPPLSLCGDNAAMIGAQGYFEYLAGNTAGMELNAYATKSILGETV